MKTMKFFMPRFAAMPIMAVVVLLGILSCKKDEKSGSVEGAATVKINLVGVETKTDNGVPSAVKSMKAASSNASKEESGLQTEAIPFGDNLALFATLSQSPLHSENTTGTTNKLKASSSNRMAVPSQNPLAPDVLYRFLVYDQTGALVAEKDYAYGKEGTEEGIVLDAGETYTFVAYSINSTSAIPAITGKGALSTATVNSVSAELMYFRKTVELVYGVNNLDVILEHQFSEITTNLVLDATALGNITAISQPSLHPAYSSANIKLSNGALTYNNALTSGQAITFPSLGSGVRSISSSPTMLIASATTEGELRLGSLTINGVTKTGLTFQNLNISPGLRYNMNLTFQSPCTEIVSGGGSFTVADGQTQTFTMPGADFGFTFDIIQLDNSFNLLINGTQLAIEEIQFQASTTPARNIQFADGSLWGINNVPQIYSMTGSATAPIIRVVIGPTGDVSMFGSKSSSGGNLEPLVLTNGNKFNKITWNSTGSNVVTATQSVVGATHMSGSGYGRRIVPCGTN
ncbi:hypothetical protein [Sphingobacterium suaedae]|uniref:Fimbrillin family protein n=1 Tax=Sphingobacterium suaedae TaxID=1686402 RepID=A0ABW5KLI5_9SPHI